MAWKLWNNKNVIPYLAGRKRRVRVEAWAVDADRPALDAPKPLLLQAAADFTAAEAPKKRGPDWLLTGE